MALSPRAPELSMELAATVFISTETKGLMMLGMAAVRVEGGGIGARGEGDNRDAWRGPAGVARGLQGLAGAHAAGARGQGGGADGGEATHVAPSL